MAGGIRADKFLWAMRIYKTRAIASDAIKNNRVSINGIVIKPSRDIQIGDLIAVKKPPIVYSFKVLALISNRQPAKEVYRYVLNTTSQAELDKLKQNVTIFVSRDRGTGRPTKKERRDIDDLMDDFELSSDWDNFDEEN